MCRLQEKIRTLKRFESISTCSNKIVQCSGSYITRQPNNCFLYFIKDKNNKSTCVMRKTSLSVRQNLLQEDENTSTLPKDDNYSPVNNSCNWPREVDTKLCSSTPSRRFYRVSG